MTAADELTAAADKLRTARFAGTTTTTPAVAGLIQAREPLALLLEGVLSSAREADHETCQHWCSPNTCDLSAALAVARAINSSSTPSDSKPQPAPADVEHCVHDRAVHQHYHYMPVDGCPWCAATLEARS
ncbi:hypothetical protein AB0K53_01125 [Streptomyces tuirus]|uniref:hypothetical protein n=1 Tax=Streptomyces tuirus TaxID=68278 RepID=UPI0034247C5F